MNNLYPNTLQLDTGTEFVNCSELVSQLSHVVLRNTNICNTHALETYDELWENVSPALTPYNIIRTFQVPI